MVANSVFTHKDDTFQCSFEVPVSHDYRVSVNGEEIPVYTCRISAYPFNTWWPGHQRPLNQSETVSYVNLVSDEDFELAVEPLTKSVDGRIMVKPYSKGVCPTVRDGRIVFSIKEHGAYVLEIDDYHGLLYIFNNKPQPVPSPEEVTYYFGKGIHFPGKLTLRSNESVYVDRDALVYGCIYAENAENLHVYGNGIFDDSKEERFHENCYDPPINGNLKFYDCKNLRIEGVGFTNSAIWCVNLFHCFDVKIDGINVFGQWRYNTDGIDVVNCRNVTVRNSFVHSFDDSITVKGIDRYDFESNRDILVEHCVLWCDWGKTCEIGLETAAPDYQSITFRDCDLLRAGNTACDIQNGDFALVQNLTFENIRVELESFYTRSQMQRSDDEVYSRHHETEIAYVLNVRNRRFREAYDFLNLEKERSVYPEGDPRYAGVCGVTAKDIQVYCDAELLQRNGTKCVRLYVENSIPTTVYRDIVVENVTLNGQRLRQEDMDVTLSGVSPDVLTVK